MQVDDLAATRQLMKAIHVLCDQRGHAAFGFPMGEHIVGGIGLGSGDMRPANEAARKALAQMDPYALRAKGLI